MGNQLSVSDDPNTIRHQRRLPDGLAVIVNLLLPFKKELLACAEESTCNWHWLVDCLMDAAYDVRLAHTGAIPEYAGIKHPNDESDARHLTHLLRLGLLPEGHVINPETRALRDLLRRRLLLVRQQTLHHLSLQSLIVRHTGERLYANQIKALNDETIT